MAERRHRLVDCNPTWVEAHGEEDMPWAVHYVSFDCPEGHEGCSHVIPFTPRLNGMEFTYEGDQRAHAVWQRTGDTFEALTLSPSIRRLPRYASREAAVAAGCILEYVTPSMLCALHVFIKDGQIEFCGDSR